MHYKFPEIHTINDVLPHIEGRKEFVVAEREDFGTVICYTYTHSDMFQMIDDNDYGVFGKCLVELCRKATNLERLILNS